MEAIKQVIKVPADRELRIRLPNDAITNEEAEVIILFRTTFEGRSAKLAAMREAMADPLFLADLHEIADDFKHADAEGDSR